MRVETAGVQFALGGAPFTFRGVTYGTFEARFDEALFPERAQIKKDLSAMAEAGFTVVRTYTPPPGDMVEIAEEFGLRIFAGVFYPDWRYLVGSSRGGVRGVAREARAAVREAARRYAGSETVCALSVGNEIPADVIRWVGTNRIAGVIAELVEAVKEEDPDQLVTYANYPTAEYLPLPTLDFLTFNVFLEDPVAYRSYLTRLHHLAGERPLVLGEIGLHAGDDNAGELRQAQGIDWQLETAVERGVAGTCVFSWTDEWCVGGKPVEGWRFGLTRADRTPRPALGVAEAWNRRTVADLEFPWPSVSVVICAYNAEATLDECLRHTCALDYPDLEVLVVDDGSTDATAEIARRHPRVQLVEIPHAGLSVARNEGMRAARGELVAYLDSDAYPTRDWLYYLALGMDSPRVGGVGGPNLPPAGDPPGAHQVSQAPGGPVHVLATDDRAEHIPGCNMAFWKRVLVEVGGCDPIYTSAGDDVDLCWRVLDRDWEIAFHPAALVWHHRRPGLRGYLRQQRGYGRSEALVEARHPNRFTLAGTARWRGRIYTRLAPPLVRQRIYRGVYGTAAYQSVYQAGGHLYDIFQQVGVPAAALLLLTAPLALLWPPAGAPALLSALFLVAMFGLAAGKASLPRGLAASHLRFRAGVAAMHVLQPLVRTWSRHRARSLARRDHQQAPSLAGPSHAVGRRVLMLPHERPREEMADAILRWLHRAGLRTTPANGWEDYDIRVVGSALVRGDLVTSAHPEGWLQVRVRRRPRWGGVALAVALVAPVALLSAGGGLALASVVAVSVGRGLWRTGPFIRKVLTSASDRATS